MGLSRLDLPRCWASATNESRSNLIQSHVLFFLQDRSAHWISQWYAWDITMKSIDDTTPHVMYFSTFTPAFIFSVSAQSETINSCDDPLHWLWSPAVIRQLCSTSVLKHPRRKFCPHLSSLSMFHGHTAHLFLTVLADTQQQNPFYHISSSMSSLSHFFCFNDPHCIWKMNMGYHIPYAKYNKRPAFQPWNHLCRGRIERSGRSNSTFIFAKCPDLCCIFQAIMLSQQETGGLLSHLIPL